MPWTKEMVDNLPKIQIHIPKKNYIPPEIPVFWETEVKGNLIHVTKSSKESFHVSINQVCVHTFYKIDRAMEAARCVANHVRDQNDITYPDLTDGWVKICYNGESIGIFADSLSSAKTITALIDWLWQGNGRNDYLEGLKVAAKYIKMSPCDNCPHCFDVPGYLSEARADEVAGYSSEDGGGQTFICHKTVGSSQEKQCAGAIHLAINQRTWTQSMQLMYRLNMWHPAWMKNGHRVFKNRDEMTLHHKKGSHR